MSAIVHNQTSGCWICGRQGSQWTSSELDRKDDNCGRRTAGSGRKGTEHVKRNSEGGDRVRTRVDAAYGFASALAGPEQDERGSGTGGRDKP